MLTCCLQHAPGVAVEAFGSEAETLFAKAQPSITAALPHGICMAPHI
jgi:hypothetical protein